ncbi:MAG: RNA-binding transcriptional accessory protein [Chloroflexi bacterium HGW-Chloroflexi-8]|nr:MAG: RNA-binding transcriptional accessory protein [Chloroflexi bacterium HGW-Chloroflexi-8]
MNYAEKIASIYTLRPHQVQATIELLDEGNTIPFIARYRKERTDSLDEEQLRQVQSGLERLRTTDERRATILKSIEEQGKLTEELQVKIMTAETLTQLEDLYLPYKPKRRTRAMIARSRGLEGLAEWIFKQLPTRTPLDEIARPFINEEVPTVEDAWQGARDIVAEQISDHPEVRATIREKAMQWGTLKSDKIPDAQDEKRVFESYYAFELRVDRIRPHQVLAINRGETEKVLRVGVQVQQRDWENAIYQYFLPNPKSALVDQMREAIQDCADRLLLPAIERDVRRALTEAAELHAILVFATNLKGLLNQPPLVGYTVLAIDPGFRTGSKVAVMDPTGKILDTVTIYPHAPQNKKEESLAILRKLIEKHHVNLISIGNGTASRETEQLAAELTRNLDTVRYLITNEAGASVYSASPLARAEMPDLDVSMRGAVSIGRRVQDPLAELVKIDPRSIGVGLYQHDVDQNELSRTLSGVVEDVVNRVGVDVNTASPALLTYISGIGQKLAERIVSYRDESGVFENREQLKKVSGLGPKAFEQSAGFLRIRDGKDPLDSSAIHPESYPVARKILSRAGISFRNTLDERKIALDKLKHQQPLPELAGELGCGLPTLEDIFEQLIRPGRDPREDLPIPILRSDVLSMDDLQVGMRMKGTVRNVVDFGAFIDIGVKQDGLMHRSQIPRGETLQVGQVIMVAIQNVEKERGRISLSWPVEKVN